MWKKIRTRETKRELKKIRNKENIGRKKGKEERENVRIYISNEVRKTGSINKK